MVFMPNKSTPDYLFEKARPVFSALSDRFERAS